MLIMGEGLGSFCLFCRISVLHDSIFLSCFTSTQIFNNSDLYLCDLFWVRRAGLQNFDLLVHVGRVHPLCSSGLFVRLIKASKQSLKRAKKKDKLDFNRKHRKSILKVSWRLLEIGFSRLNQTNQSKVVDLVP